MKVADNSVWEESYTEQLAWVLTSIGDQQTMQSFLRDVMTEKEILEISARLEAAKMLHAGKSYVEVTDKTKLSSRTVARISDWMRNGTGGYNTVLDQLETVHHSHIPPARAS